MEVDPGEFLKSCAVKHALQHGMKEALEEQVKHRAALGVSAAGAVAEGSACEWKPGMGKTKKAAAAAAAVEGGSACEWTPGKRNTDDSQRGAAFDSAIRSPYVMHEKTLSG